MVSAKEYSVLGSLAFVCAMSHTQLTIFANSASAICFKRPCSALRIEVSSSTIRKVATAILNL